MASLRVYRVGAPYDDEEFSMRRLGIKGLSKPRRLLTLAVGISRPLLEMFGLSVGILCNVEAQSNVEPEVCILGEPPTHVASELRATNTAQQAASSNLQQCRAELAQTSHVVEQMPPASRADYLSVRFFRTSAPIRLSEAGLKSITIRFKGHDTSLPLDSGDLVQYEYQFQMAVFKDATQSDFADVIVTYQPPGAPASQTIDRFVRRGAPIAVSVCIAHLQGDTSYACRRDGLLTASRSNIATPSAEPNDTIVVWFQDGDKPLTRLGARLTALTLHVTGSDVITNKVADDYDESATVFPIPLTDLRDHPQAESEELDVSVVDYDVQRFYFNLKRSSELYGRSGFWLPIGLFSTDFKAATNDGIPLSPAPVGLGWGKKLFFGKSENSYIGLTLFTNWQLTPGSDAQGKPNGSYGLKGLTLGGLVDVLDYAYLGGGEVFAKGSSPRTVLVIGPGPTLLKILKLLGGKGAS